MISHQGAPEPQMMASRVLEDPGESEGEGVPSLSGTPTVAPGTVGLQTDSRPVPVPFELESDNWETGDINKG